MVHKKRQFETARQHIRCEQAGDLAETHHHPRSSWLPPPFWNPPLVKAEETGTKHLAVGVAIEVHTGEVVTDHRPLPEPVRVTVDDAEPAVEEEAESLLKLSGPTVRLQQWGHVRMLSLGPSPRIRLCFR